MLRLPAVCSSLLAVLALAACDAEGDTVGAEGGVVVSADGRVSLDIPAGALDGDVTISIERVDGGPDGSVGRVYAITPRLTALNKPAALTYDLVEDGVEDDEMGDAMLITERADDWAPLSDHDVDMETGLATGSVLYFSRYAVVLQ